MKNTIEIRRAGSADLPEIVRIEQACFGAEAFSRRQLRYLVMQARGVCFVAMTTEEIATAATAGKIATRTEEEITTGTAGKFATAGIAATAGKIRGYVSLLERPRYDNLRLYSVAVAPEAQGLGIGQALLSRTIAYAREYGLGEISLEVSIANTTAQALYRKNGFVCTTRLPNYYHDGDGWRMVRSTKERDK